MLLLQQYFAALLHNTMTLSEFKKYHLKFGCLAAAAAAAAAAAVAYCVWQEVGGGGGGGGVLNL